MLSFSRAAIGSVLSFLVASNALAIDATISYEVPFKIHNNFGIFGEYTEDIAIPTYEYLPKLDPALGALSTTVQDPIRLNSSTAIVEAVYAQSNHGWLAAFSQAEATGQLSSLAVPTSPLLFPDYQGDTVWTMMDNGTDERIHELLKGAVRQYPLDPDYYAGSAERSTYQGTGVFPVQVDLSGWVFLQEAADARGEHDSEFGGLAVVKYIYTPSNPFNGASPGWNDTGNWSGGTPNGACAVAYLGAGGGTVNLNVPVTLGTLVFDSSTSYTLAGPNALTMDCTNPTHINVAQGSHTISANVSLAQHTTATVSNASDTLTMSGTVTGTGKTLTKAGSGTLKLSGTTSVGAARVVNGTLNVESGGSMTSSGIATVDPSGVLTVNGSATVKRVESRGTVNVNGTLTVPTDGTATGMSTFGSLSIGASGLLQLNDNDFIVDYAAGETSPEFTLRDKVKAIALGGTSGISYTAGAGDVVIAVAEKTEWGQSEFNGIALDDTTVIGKYTYYGDANLDGAVTGDDYVAVDVGLGVGDSWVQGDFDMNGAVTSDDYVAIDVNLGKGTTNPLAFAELKAEMVALHAEMFGEQYLAKLAAAEANGFSVVPEPGAFGLLGLSAIGLLRRRRRTGERNAITRRPCRTRFSKEDQMVRVSNGTVLGAAAAAALSLLPPAQAQAGMSYDLRFSDGTSARTVTATGTHSLQLWARVTGTDANHLNDGLQTNYIVLQSQEISGDAFTSTFTSGLRSVPFNASGSRSGLAAELNGDGVQDWGSTSTSLTNTGYMLARSAGPTMGGATSSTSQQVDTNTWEFRVATFTLNITGVNLGGGETRIAVVKPAATTSGTQPAYAVYWDDATLEDDGDPESPDSPQPGSQSTVTSTNQAGVYGDYVTLTVPGGLLAVPEPHALSLVSLAGAAIMGRRRRRS